MQQVKGSMTHSCDNWDVNMNCSGCALTGSLSSLQFLNDPETLLHETIGLPKVRGQIKYTSAFSVIVCVVVRMSFKYNFSLAFSQRTHSIRCLGSSDD